jgi:hypothetical protein
MQNLFFTVPQSLCNIRLVLESAAGQRHAEKHSDKYLWFIDCLYQRRFQKGKQEPIENYVKMNSTVLSKVLGSKEYLEVVRNLIRLNIIECNRSYVVGSHSRGYRLTLKFWNEQTVFVQATDIRFVERVRRQKEERLTTQIRERKLNKETYKHLISNVQNLQLSDLDLIYNTLVYRLFDNYQFLHLDIHDYLCRPSHHTSDRNIKANVEHTWMTLNESCPPSSNPCMLTMLPSYTHSYSQGSSTTHNKLQNPMPLGLEPMLKSFDKLRSDIMETFLSSNPGPKKNTCLTTKEWLNFGCYPWKKFDFDFRWIRKFARRDLYHFVDNKGYRFHTNFTNMSSHLRRYICVNGEQLYGIDIRNSQPLIFAVVLINEYKRRRKQYRKVADVKHYVELCAEGKFYEYLMDCAKIPAEDAEARDKFKKTFFKHVFFNQNPRGEEPYYIQAKIFEEQFPNVWAFLLEQKQLNYKSLAISMQRSEAELILDIVCGELTSKYPKIPLLTLHDSIFTTSQYVHNVQAVIVREFKRKCGIEPTLVIEDPVKFPKSKMILEYEKLALAWREENQFSQRLEIA